MAFGKNRIGILVTAEDKASKKLQTVQKNAGKLSGVIGGMSKLAGPVGIAAGATVALGTVAIKAGAEYSKSFAQVATLLDDMTKKEIRTMNDDLMELSNTMGIKVMDSVDALYQAISGGIPQDSWIEFMSTAMELSKAGAAELKPVVGVLAGVIQNYALDVGETERVSNLLLKTVKLGVTTMDELGSSLGDLLPSSKAAGLGLEETLGTLASLTKTSGNTAKSVTQFRALLLEVMRPTTRLAKAIKTELGASFDDLVASGQSLGGIMQNLKSKMPEEEFKSVFGSAEAMNAAFGITGDLHGNFVTALENMAEAAGTLTAALDIVQEAPGEALTEAANRLENAKIELGEALAEPAAEIIEGATRAAEWEVSWGDFGKSIGYGFVEIVDTLFNPFNLDLGEGYNEYMKYRGKGKLGSRKYWDQSMAERFGMGTIGDKYGTGGFGAEGGIGQGVDIPGIVNAAMGTGGRAAAEALAGLSGATAGWEESVRLSQIEKERQMFGWGAGWTKQARGSGIDDLGAAINAAREEEEERIVAATQSMIPFKNDLDTLSEASRIANETFGMTAEKTAALAAIEEEAAATLAELTAALEAGTISFEDVESSWAKQIEDAADAIEDIRVEEENKVVDAIEEAARQQAEEAARQLKVSKVQISMMGKSLEEIVSSGQLVGMTKD